MLNIKVNEFSTWENLYTESPEIGLDISDAENSLYISIDQCAELYKLLQSYYEEPKKPKYITFELSAIER